MSAKGLLPSARPERSPIQLGLPAGRQSSDRGALSLGPGLSLRLNFAWALAGNVVYTACQWGIIVALAKLGSSFMVGQFSLGLAIATPVLVFTNLHLRGVQATDAKRVYSFAEYLQLRIVLTLVAMVVIFSVTWFGQYERRTSMVIMAVASAKGIETLSDIHYGLFQLNDHLDHTGRSMMLRGVLSLAALSGGLYLTRDVFWGCVALAAVWLAALLLFDVQRGRRFVRCLKQTAQLADSTVCWQQGGRLSTLQRHWNLMCLALPLGIVTTCASINLNMPRYFIHARMGEHQLGIFSAMAYTTVALTVMSDSLGHCAIPRMSRLYASGLLTEFRQLLLRLVAVGGALGLAGVAIAQVMGARLLAVFYGPEYAAHSRVFILLVLATAIHCIACVLTTAVTSARYFRVQVPIFALVLIASVAGCAHWVPTAGLVGGAVAMVVASTVHLVLAAAIVVYLLSTPPLHVRGCSGAFSPQSTVGNRAYDIHLRLH